MHPDGITLTTDSFATSIGTTHEDLVQGNQDNQTSSYKIDDMSEPHQALDKIISPSKKFADGSDNDEEMKYD